MMFRANPFPETTRPVDVQSGPEGVLPTRAVLRTTTAAPGSGLWCGPQVTGSDPFLLIA